MKVLITGASSGIGKDMARIMAEKKNDLILVARNKEELEKVAKELSEKFHVKIDVLAKDLSIEENCIDIFNSVKDVDILINNAGFGDCGFFEKTSLEKDLKMIETNIVAYHILTKLYLKEMKEKNNGKILNVASIAGFMPGPLMATYYSTKAYVVRLSEAIKEELKREKSDVQISVLCPGPVDTNFNKVANVMFKLKEADSMSVAKYAINKFEKGKFYIIPGLGVRLSRIGVRFVPNFLISKIIFYNQKRKIYK